jgi:hypothetical protein
MATAPKANNGKALASMIVGIVSVLACLCWLIALPGGVVAVILGIIGRKEIAQGKGTNGGMALTGIITGAVAIAIGLGWVALMLFGDDSGTISYCIDNPDSWICTSQ